MKHKGIIFLLLTTCFAVKSFSQSRPNIVFIVSDDQRMEGTIHYLGGKEVITPNLDALAKSGTSFMNAYIMGGTSGAVCAPSRNMFLTGRNIFSIGGGEGVDIPKGNTTIGETLKQNGYFTYGIGKWHQNYSAFYNSFMGGAAFFWGGMAQNPYNWKMQFYGKDEPIMNNRHHTEVFGETAVNFIKSYNKSEPFFLYVSFMSPHDPRITPPQFKAMYDSSKIKLPQNFLPKHPFDNGELIIRDEQLAATPRVPQEIKNHIRDYYAMMTHLDVQVGNIINALKEKGQLENTIIIYAGDNGLALGKHGLMGKQNVYEHSIKVPLIFSGPGIKKDTRTSGFVYLIDIFPTVCNLTGIPVPATVQGQAVLGKNSKSRETTLHIYKDFQKAVHKGHYKLIIYNVKGQRHAQLFDLAKDPYEMYNLAAIKKYDKKVKEMRDLLDAEIRKAKGGN